MVEASGGEGGFQVLPDQTTNLYKMASSSGDALDPFFFTNLLKLAKPLRSLKTLNHKSRSMSSFARRAMSLARIPSAGVSASVCQRRGLASAADHHGSTKVDFWKQPTNPGNWKEEHFVLISLSGWGLVFYGGYKLFTGGKGEKPVEASQ